MPVRENTELVLGRGEVFLERFVNGVSINAGEEYVGNTPSFQIIREIERLENFASYRGRKTQTRGQVISESVEVKMTTDHINWQNIAVWFGGNPVVTSSGNEFFPYSESFTAKKGRFYQLGRSETPTGFNFVERVTVTRDEIVLRPGVDYDVEPELGRVQILNSAIRIYDGAVFTVNYYKRPDKVTNIQSYAAEVYGAMRYISRNPYGPQTDYWFPQVRIAPQGAMEMKEDGFQQMRFDVTAIRAAPTTPLLFAIRKTGAPMPITADTSLLSADNTIYRADLGAWV